VERRFTLRDGREWRAARRCTSSSGETHKPLLSLPLWEILRLPMRIIKKVLFGIAPMMLFTSSNAEWTLTATSGVLDAYVDFKEVVLEGNYAKSKRLVDYRKEQLTEKGEIYWSSTSIFTYDCIKKIQQVERVRFTGGMGGGVPIKESVFTSEWEKVVAGTPNDNYMVRACSGGD
jgi:hypothetical protein